MSKGSATWVSVDISLAISDLERDSVRNVLSLRHRAGAARRRDTIAGGADAVIEALRHRARALHHRIRVIGDVVGGQAVVLGVLHVVIDFRRAQQRLGRDAPPVEADAAEIGALDDRRLEAELRRADRGDIASRAGADDDDVEGFGHCGLR
jgi:hypothetical protein